jgi:hypothetical protein
MLIIIASAVLLKDYFGIVVGLFFLWNNFPRRHATKNDHLVPSRSYCGCKI